MTQLQSAREGKITEEMKFVAKYECVDEEFIRQGVADGNIVIVKGARPLGIGKGLRTKVNANIGTSQDFPNLDDELDKLKVAISAGADTVMDLSTGGDLDEIRRTIIKESSVPVGTVPIYQVAIDSAKKNNKSLVEMTEDEIFNVIEEHGESGVGFITVHCGVTQETYRKMRNEGRIMDIVSRGGTLMVEWMKYNKKENPLYEHFDRLLEIAKKYDMVLSLGDGFRPGCIADATDRSQIHELIILGELTKRAWDYGVQVMIEGPGHVPINQIEANVLLEKRLCHNAPFYVLGPLVTDIAPGYDHITSAIGGAIAASAGADFLCYVTPSEHLSLPTLEDVHNGVISARISAHAGDIAKGVKSAIDWDITMARYRKKLDWEGQINTSIDPDTANTIRTTRKPIDSEVCTMCGSLCAIKLQKEK